MSSEALDPQKTLVFIRSHGRSFRMNHCSNWDCVNWTCLRAAAHVSLPSGIWWSLPPPPQRETAAGTGRERLLTNTDSTETVRTSVFHLMLYLMKLVIHVGYCEMWISQELKHTLKLNEQPLTCSIIHSLMLLSLYLLFQVQQRLSVRPQHGVQPGAESPQVTPVKSRLVGLVRVMLLQNRGLTLQHMIGPFLQMLQTNLKGSQGGFFWDMCGIIVY